MKYSIYVHFIKIVIAFFVKIVENFFVINMIQKNIILSKSINLKKILKKNIQYLVIPIGLKS